MKTLIFKLLVYIIFIIGILIFISNFINNPVALMLAMVSFAIITTVFLVLVNY